MKYILDFDRTLFDTEKFYLEGGDVSYLPEVWDKFSACDFLYDDVAEWMAGKQKEDLFILTAISYKYGPQAGEYQEEKLACSKLNGLVQEVIYTDGLKGKEVLSLAEKNSPDETFVFVDDRIEQCLSVKQTRPSTICCLMVRNKSVIGDVESIQGIHVVHCLADVDAIIKTT